MDIIIASTDPIPHLGGKSSHIGLLLRQLGDRGYGTRLLSPAQAGQVENFVARAGAKAASMLRGGWGETLARGYWRSRIVAQSICLLAGGNSVLNAHDVFAVPPSGKQPTVLTVHGYAYEEAVSARLIRPGTHEARLIRQWEDAAYRNAAHIISVDTRISQYILSLVPEASDRLTVLPNAVDTEVYSPAVRAFRDSVRASWGIPQHAAVAICPRRLVPKNGVRYAVEALAHAVRYAPDTYLVLAGEGQEASSLKLLAQALGVRDKVVFLGGVPTDEMPKVYGGADMAVIPSVTSAGVQEATSIAALEAMSCGLAVIATDVGGLREIFSNPGVGYLVPEQNAEALGNVLGEAAIHPELREQIGDQARRHVVHRHAAANHTDSYLGVFERVGERFRQGVAYGH
ncbi:MAG: glycosyltransferase family 4 protein [Symbiobacteriia bacterium]